MSLCKKFGLALISAAFAIVAAVPAAHAQTRSGPYVFQLGAPGGSYLGIRMEDVTSDKMARYQLTSERGVIVSSVQSGSPASEAGLKEGDVILEFGGTPVWSSAQFARLVEETPAGRKVEMALSRDGKKMTLTARIGSREERQSDNRSDNRRRSLPDDWFEGFPFYSYRSPDSRAGQEARKPRLGVELMPLTEQYGEVLGVPGKKGALIASVQEGTPSAGKLKAGDVIIQADGKQVNGPEELTRIVRDAEGEMSLKVIRDKKELTVVVNLPAAEGSKGGIKL